MNNRVFSVILILLSICTNSVTAQNSTTVKELFERYKSKENISATFTTMGNSFELISSNKKFFMKGVGIETIFDGKYLYSYNAQSNEVVIEELSSDDLLSNPSNIFRLEYADFDIAELTSNTFKLTPKDESDINHIKLIVDNNNIKSLEIFSKDDTTIYIEFLSISFPVSVDNSKFKFNKNSYPKAEIIDFR